MLVERDAAHAHGDAAGPEEPPLQQQQLAARRQGAVADIEVVAARDAEFAGAAATDQKRLDMAGRIERAFGDRDQRAGAGQPLGDEGQAFDAPCCWEAA